MMITSETIVNGMAIGKCYHSRALAKKYGVSTKSMSATLNTLVHRGILRNKVISGATAWYRPEGEVTMLKPVKPYQPSRELMAAAARVGEMRAYPSKHN
jgi:DNA-binding transcriptional MocR family regulator